MQNTARSIGSGQGPRLLPRNRHGDGSGTRIVMVAGFRGEEISGVHTLGMFHQHLIQWSNALTGTLDLMPVIGRLGPDGIGHMATRRGDGVLNQATQDELVQELSGADLVIHLNDEDPGLNEVPQVHLLQHRQSALLRVCEAANVDVVCLRRRFVPGSLAERLEAASIPVMELHTGCGLRADRQRQMIRGLTTLAEALGVLGGPHLGSNLSTPRPRVVDEVELRSVVSPVSGFFFPMQRECWSDVWEGDVLGSLFDPQNGAELSKVYAPEQGSVLALRTGSFVDAGSLLARIAPALDE